MTVIVGPYATARYWELAMTCLTMWVLSTGRLTVSSPGDILVCKSEGNLGGELARRYTIQAVIYPGDESGYVAECLNLAVVTQVRRLETVQNLREAIQLHLEGEDTLEMGLAPHAPVLVTMEMEPVYA